jgi:hypothetical protein
MTLFNLKKSTLLRGAGIFEKICPLRSCIVVFSDFGASEKKPIISNFDPTFRGRYEVRKNKLTPYCLAEFHEESEKNSVFAPENLFLDQIWLL